ncbi:MAG: hypothetical protein G01um101456_697 [Parcubacteria group bacterium Gr01-1014_56]|nr:MAG: hypothetical protein G01um101456_697 [Parcubacteria group bacterium Gr01-1014_56]
MRMPLWLWSLTGVAIIAVALYAAVLAGWVFSTPPVPDSVFCTQDAMQCPDGSYVGRTGPNCEFVCPVTTTPTTPTQVTVEAQIGKSATALGVDILPLEVVEDSRCPVDVQCVWAGRVSVSVRIHSAMGESTMTFTPGTPVTTEAQTITLLDVKPSPYAGVTIKQSQYVFIFQIEKRK